ncbi:ABC transporter substrate-binding protein [Noviherbaspirillum galbum]|uniref:ABC transporter substrate-binding protein n=1 Tax=Noviherbaspirillum galbum TaxID=2709383 RepID=A0A6B3SF82_9BURK|nr:ABC transporter substrate-binding protein [Noviherbaspirillum galbum]NEX59557.1 ABC transporter substrate-binding protein [Noviherbaspirillum galbum]
MYRLVVCTAVAFAAASFPAIARDITEIRFGTDPGNAPFEFKTKDGKLAGFDIELGDAICAHLKAKCTWVENDFDGMIPALKAKKFDAINASMSITEKRLKEIDFSNRVTLSPPRMIAKAGANLLPTAESLKGKRIGVQQGTTHETFAKEKLARNGVDVVSYAKNDQIYADLQAGRLDAGLMDAVEATEGFLKKPAGKGFAYAGPVLKDEKIFGTGTGFGVRKGDAELKEALNKALADLKANGTYKKIMTKYFDTDVSGD